MKNEPNGLELDIHGVIVCWLGILADMRAKLLLADPKARPVFIKQMAAGL